MEYLSIPYGPNDPKPTAHIAVNKNRLKTYNTNNNDVVYLKDNQSFQIELYNPTSNKILATIFINGKLMQGGGIVLRPAERVFLERYLNENRKLLFSTYQASGAKAEIEKAIQNNGKIEIKFFEENTYDQLHLNANNWPTDYPYYTYDINDAANSGTSHTYFDTTQCELSADFSGHCDLKVELSCDTTPISSAKSSRTRSIKKKTKTVETGRIEKGDESKQNFENDDTSFSPFVRHTVDIQILPISQKIDTSATINVRRYCHECGTKIKQKTAKFCFSCGTKL